MGWGGETYHVQKDKSKNDSRILFGNNASKKQCSNIFKDPKEKEKTQSRTMCPMKYISKMKAE